MSDDIAHGRSSYRGLTLIIIKTHLLFLIRHSFQAQPDTLLSLVHLDDFETKLLTDRQVRVRDRSVPSSHVGGNLTAMAKTFHSRQQLDKDSELSHSANLPGHDIADIMISEECLPCVRLELLDSKRKPPAGCVDIQDHRLDYLSFFHNFGRVLDAYSPRHIGNVD